MNLVPDVKFDLAEYSKKFLDFNFDAYSKAAQYYEDNMPELTDLENTVTNFYMWGSINSLTPGKYLQGYMAIREYNTNGQYADLLKDYTEGLEKYVKDKAIIENLKVYRMVEGNEFTTYLKTLKKGELFTDKSFVSTSLIQQKDFGDFTIEIFCEKGTQVANLVNGKELEYLIQKNSTFKVLESATEKKIVLQLLP